jgi:RNA polymerase sigma factor (sigma-70 family)
VNEEYKTVIGQLLPKIRKMAKRMRQRFPSANVDDLQQAGAQGVLHAMTRADYADYDASKGKLETRFHEWIDGAMKMHIRKDITSHRFEREAADAVRDALDKQPFANGAALAARIDSSVAMASVYCYSHQTPEDLLIEREDAADLNAFFATLSESDRALVRLRFVEERPRDEVVKLLGYSLATLHRREAKLRERLREHLADGC